ncbi:Transcriptional regulator ClgR [compost metagenome]
MKDFGDYLKDQRERRKWTLRHAAEQIGTSASRLSEIERGQSYHTGHATRPSRELVERIARAYDLPLQVLLASAGYPEVNTPELSAEARIAAALFENLSPERKDLALGMLHLLAESKGTRS